jgi:hypothetical protein
MTLRFENAITGLWHSASTIYATACPFAVGRLLYVVSADSKPFVAALVHITFHINYMHIIEYYIIFKIKYKILTAMSIKIAVFSNVAPCSLVSIY